MRQREYLNALFVANSFNESRLQDMSRVMKVESIHVGNVKSNVHFNACIKTSSSHCFHEQRLPICLISNAGNKIPAARNFILFT